jgi:hypothetical protein
MRPIHSWNNGTNKMDLTEILISFDNVDQIHVVQDVGQRSAVQQ